MRVGSKRVAALGAAGLALAGGGGAALATTGGHGVTAGANATAPSAEADAFLADVASRLGISVAKLKDAVKGAALARLDAAVAAGRISQSDADELRSAIEAGAVPLLGGFGGVAGVGHVRIGPFGGPLDAAAKAIGIDVSTLRSELENGKTLAQVAGEHGVSTDALVQALLADAKSHLDAAVKAGRMTSDQESQALSDLKSHLDELVNGSHVGLMIPKA